MKGLEAQDSDNPIAKKNMEWGTLHERDNKNRFYELTGLWFMETGFWEYKKDLRLGGSPDGITINGALLECKCPVNHFPCVETLDQSQTMAQIQGLMNMLELPQCYLSYWMPNAYMLVKVDRDTCYWDCFLEPLLQEFLYYVRNDIEPPSLPRRRSYQGIIGKEVLYDIPDYASYLQNKNPYLF